MVTFDSTKTSLYDILKDINKGKIQLTDFQRGWVWDDDRIKGIIASVVKSFPIGAVILLLPFLVFFFIIIFLFHFIHFL